MSPIIVCCLLLLVPYSQAGETTTISAPSNSTSSQNDPLSVQSSEMTETSSVSNQHHETLQGTESFQQSHRTPSHENNERKSHHKQLSHQQQRLQQEHSTYQDEPKSAGSNEQSSTPSIKEQYDTSLMMQAPSHFTLVSNQQVSPGHVTMIGYTTPIVKAGGFIRVTGEDAKAATSEKAAASAPSGSSNFQPLEASVSGENTLNDIQSQLLQYASNSIYATSEAQQRLQHQQMAKLIASAAEAAEKAPLRAMPDLVSQSSPRVAPASIQQTGSLSHYQVQQGEAGQQAHQDAATELVEDFPSKMNYKNYAQHTRLPYRMPSEEEAKSTGAFSAPLDKPKPFLVYKPGYEKISNIDQQASFQPVMSSQFESSSQYSKPMNIVADKGQFRDMPIADVGNELTSGLNRQNQYLSRGSPQVTEREVYGQSPLKSAMMTYKGMTFQAMSNPGEHHSSQYHQVSQDAHIHSPQTHQPPQYSRGSQMQSQYQQDSGSRPIEYNFQSQKLQTEPPRSSSTHMQASPNEEGGSKYDPKSELLSQINFMLTNSPNLSDESRTKHRGSIENTLRQVEEAFGRKSSEMKMAPGSSGQSSLNGHFKRYREAYTHEEPVKIVSTVNKVPQYRESMPVHNFARLSTQRMTPAPQTYSYSSQSQQYQPSLQSNSYPSQSPQHQSPPQSYNYPPQTQKHQPPAQRYHMPESAAAPVKFDDFSPETYSVAPEYGSQLKSNRLQQKIQQFVTEQMTIEDKRGARAMSPQYLAGTPQAAYIQKYSNANKRYAKLQMLAPAGTQALTIDSNLLASQPSAPNRYTLAREMGQLPSALASAPSALKVTDPSNNYATYFSQQQISPTQMEAGIAYRNQQTSNKISPTKSVRSNSEWWKETSIEPKPTNYYMALQ